jgi:ribulose-5-phosphate 4-epimerase/fuculose-1-phosphate aldolase
MCRWGRSLFERGPDARRSGNLSAGSTTGFLVTRRMRASAFSTRSRLSKLDSEGRHLSGDAPTKEVPLHMAVYDARPRAVASCISIPLGDGAVVPSEIDPTDALPPSLPMS